MSVATFSTSHDRILAALRAAGCELTPSANGHETQCPIHGDRKASLSVGTGTDGRVLLHCHVGCETRAVVEALGMSMSDLMPPRESHASNGESQIAASSNGTPLTAAKKPVSTNSKSRITHKYDYIDEYGTLLFQVVRFDPKDFRQRQPLPGGKWKWSVKGVRQIPFNLPNIIAHPDRPVLITEGEKDVQTLGAMGALATCNAGGAGKWKAELAEFLCDRRVIILPDNDDPGRKHVEQVARSLSGKATRIQVIELPGLPEKGDVSDWFAAGGTKQQLSQLIDSTPDWEPSGKSAKSGKTRKKVSPATASPTEIGNRQLVKITPDEHILNQEAIAGLAKSDAIFQRAGLLVHVVSETTDHCDIVRRGTPHIRQLPPAMLRETLAQTCYFAVETDEGMAQKTPPKACVDAIYSRGQWKGIRVLEGVTPMPTLRPDGSILDQPGYDSQTRLLFQPAGEIPAISGSPSRADAVRAMDQILDVVKDFDFAKPAHKAAFVAALLTPLARSAFHGPCPLFLIDANVRGSGKSLLADVIGLIVLGRTMPRMSNPRDDEEARKRITAIAQADDLLVLIDNVVGNLGGPSLDAAITGEIWRDRILGRTEMVEMPLRSVWCATGNNVILTSDMPRRCCHIRIESKDERPEERTGFTNPDLRAYVRESRQHLLTAALTVLRAFFVAGRPQAKLTPWGSFDGWSDLIRQVIVWCDLPDPADSRRELAEQADLEVTAINAVIAGWQELDPNNEGLTSQQIAYRMSSFPNAYSAIRGGLSELCKRDLNARAIGNALRRFKRRNIGGKMIDAAPGRSNYKVWTVMDVESTIDDCGESGESNSGHMQGETHGQRPSSGESGEYDESFLTQRSFEVTKINNSNTHSAYIGGRETDSPDSPDSPRDNEQIGIGSVASSVFGNDF